MQSTKTIFWVFSNFTILYVHHNAKQFFHEFLLVNKRLFHVKLAPVSTLMNVYDSVIHINNLIHTLAKKKLLKQVTGRRRIISERKHFIKKRARSIKTECICTQSKYSVRLTALQRRPLVHFFTSFFSISFLMQKL